MMTSGTGGYLFHTTKIFPSTYQADSNQHFNRKKGRNAAKAKSGAKDGGAEEDDDEGEDDEVDEALDAEEDEAMEL